jgi:mono/diheme cytochrome c family protein
MPTSCVVCHADDESTRIGTGWEGYYGSQVMLVDGTVVTVDDEYIRESIVDPNAKVVEGFSPDVMPQSYGDVLSDGDIEAIIAYIKSFQ